MKYKATARWFLDGKNISVGNIIEANPEFQIDPQAQKRLEPYEPAPREKFIPPRGLMSVAVYAPYTALANGKFRAVRVAKNDRVYAVQGTTVPRYFQKVR